MTLSLCLSVSVSHFFVCSRSHTYMDGEGVGLKELGKCVTQKIQDHEDKIKVLIFNFFTVCVCSVSQT